MKYLALILLTLPVWGQTNATDWLVASVNNQETSRAMLRTPYGDTTNLIFRVRDHKDFYGKRLTKAHSFRSAASTNATRVALVPFGQTNEFVLGTSDPATAAQSVSIYFSPGVALFPGDEVRVLSESDDTEVTRRIVLEVE